MSELERVPAGVWATLTALATAALMKGVPALWRSRKDAEKDATTLLREQLAAAVTRAELAEKGLTELRESLGAKNDATTKRAVAAEMACLEIMTWMRARYPDEADQFDAHMPTGIQNLFDATKAASLPAARLSPVDRALHRADRGEDVDTPPGGTPLVPPRPGARRNPR